MMPSFAALLILPSLFLGPKALLLKLTPLF